MYIIVVILGFFYKLSVYWELLKVLKVIDRCSNVFLLKKINNILLVDLNQNTNIYINTKFIKIIKNFFTHSFVIYFLRIIWRGKAYRIRFFKKSSKFTLNFGHSHWCKILYNSDMYSFFRIRRQNYLLFFKNRIDFSFLKNSFNTIRKYNKYNRRGIRLKKIYFLKRFGKISQVNSILHNF